MKLDITDRVTCETTRWKVYGVTYSKGSGAADKATCWRSYGTTHSTTHVTTDRATRDAIKKFMKSQS